MRRPRHQNLRSRPPRTGCITTCRPSRLPTSSCASRGAFLLMVESSSRPSRPPRDHLGVIELPARRTLRGGLPPFLLNAAKQASPGMMLFGVSVIFNSRREAPDFEGPSHAMTARSPSGSRTARQSLRVDTLNQVHGSAAKPVLDLYRRLGRQRNFMA